MAEAAHLELRDRASNDTERLRARRAPKIFAMRGMFAPRPEKRAPREARVPAIRAEVRPQARQERLHIERRREQQRTEDLRRQHESLIRFSEREERQRRELMNILSAGAAFIGTIAALGVASAIVLGFQSILASLEGAAAVLPAVGFEVLRGVLTFLAAGDPTFTAATLFVGMSLLIATRNMVVSGNKVREDRRRWSHTN